MLKPTIVLEIGCNHKGSYLIAKDMIEQITSVESPFNTVIKFQKRNAKELLSEEQYNAPHPNPKNSYGKTYGEHRKALELDIHQHKDLKHLIESLGMIYSTSIWDMTSCKEVVSLEPELIKIPSAMNTNYEMLDYLCKNYSGRIHLSLGMTTKKEEKEILNIFRINDRRKDLVLYACTSGYPIEESEVYALELKRLQCIYKGIINSVGYSSHLKGIDWDVLLCAMGASYLERHFTLNKKWKGTDHSASIDLKDYIKLVNKLKILNEIMQYKPEKLIDTELTQYNKLKYKEEVII